jgi:hypothetical protein
MSGFKVSLYTLVLVLVFGTTGHGQVAQPYIPGNGPGFTGLCPQQSPPRPVSRTVEVNVPVPCPAPAPCMQSNACAPPPCYPVMPCCPPPCPTTPVKVRVDVVVRPESPKPCMPQRYCCENPPVFEPIFYHAAWMLKSIVSAPLGLGECMLGHGTIPKPCPPPIPVACMPCQVAPCPPVSMCAPPLPQCLPQPQPRTQCRLPAPLATQTPSCPPQEAFKLHRSAPIAR